MKPATYGSLKLKRLAVAVRYALAEMCMGTHVRELEMIYTPTQGFVLKPRRF